MFLEEEHIVRSRPLYMEAITMEGKKSGWQDAANWKAIRKSHNCLKF